jgi:hypothetical protein
MTIPAKMTTLGQTREGKCLGSDYIPRPASMIKNNFTGVVRPPLLPPACSSAAAADEVGLMNPVATLEAAIVDDPMTERTFKVEEGNSNPGKLVALACLVLTMVRNVLDFGASWNCLDD